MSLNHSAGRHAPVAGAVFRRQVASGALAQGRFTLWLFQTALPSSPIVMVGLHCFHLAQSDVCLGFASGFRSPPGSKGTEAFEFF